MSDDTTCVLDIISGIHDIYRNARACHILICLLLRRQRPAVQGTFSVAVLAVVALRKKKGRVRTPRHKHSLLQDIHKEILHGTGKT